MYVCFFVHICLYVHSNKDIMSFFSIYMYMICTHVSCTCMDARIHMYVHMHVTFFFFFFLSLSLSLSLDTHMYTCVYTSMYVYLRLLSVLWKIAWQRPAENAVKDAKVASAVAVTHGGGGCWSEVKVSAADRTCMAGDHE